MGLKDQLIIAQITPGADVPLSMLDEVYRSFKLAIPTGVGYLPERIVDHDQGPRLQKRMHEPIVRTDVSITVFFQIEPIQHREREFAPTLDHPAKVSGAAKVDPRIEGKRHQRLAIGVERNGMSGWKFK